MQAQPAATKQIRNVRMKRDDNTMKDDDGAVIDPRSHIQDRTMDKLLRSSSILMGGVKPTRSRSVSGKSTGELGLQIYIAPDGDENNIHFDYCMDSHYSNIHPNVFAPASLMNVRRMGGECLCIP
jgi:hypothetical protein